jgi:hypothetical protein
MTKHHNRMSVSVSREFVDNRGHEGEGNGQQSRTAAPMSVER